MAIVTGPLHSSEARGGLGSLVYNTWRGISYVKTNTPPATQYSPAQIALRLLAANATVSWQGLTDLQRAKWTYYANAHPDHSWTGSPKRLSGYNWYLRVNVKRQQMGLSIQTIPPTHQVRHTVHTLTIAYAAGNVDITWSNSPAYTPTSLRYEFWLVGPHSAAAHPSIRMAMWRGYSTYASGTFNDTVALPGWYTYFVRPLHSLGTSGGYLRQPWQAA